MREISYQSAIKEAFQQSMHKDPKVFLIGQGLDSPWSFGDTTLGLFEEFGSQRVFDPPVSESGTTGAAIGAAMTGSRPIVMHPRIDFMYLAMDQIINHASHWHNMFGGLVNVPVVIRGVVNRGNEQAAQHSQSPHAMYAHVPGLKVVMPTTPSDAKGLLLSAIRDENPVIYFDDRWLYSDQGPVSEEMFYTPIGKANICRKGTDVTVVAVSYMVKEALTAAEILAKKGISIEVIDLRTIKPFDQETIIKSVKKTEHLLIADGGWKSFGISGEIASCVTENAWNSLKTAPIRLGCLDAPVPAARTLEKDFFPNAQQIINSIMQLTKKKS